MNIKMYGKRFFQVSEKWMIDNFAVAPCMLGKERVCDQNEWVWALGRGGRWVCYECGWGRDE